MPADKIISRARRMSSPSHANNFLHEMLGRKIAKRNRLLKMLEEVDKDIEEIEKEIEKNNKVIEAWQ